MAETGKQSPLGVNVLGSLLQNIGFYINPTAQSYMGVNKSTDGEYTPGKVVNDTCLKWLTYAINDAYKRGAASQSNPVNPSSGYTVDANTYNNLLNIGQSRIPALGNSPPPTWETTDPGNVWINQHTDFYSAVQAGGPANSGYGFYNWNSPVYDDNTNKQNAYKTEGQLASWYPFLSTVEVPAGEFIVSRTYAISQLGSTDWNVVAGTTGITYAVGDILTAVDVGSGTGYAYGAVPNAAITQWGWIRCMALQAANEFNWNGQYTTSDIEYKNFTDTFMTTAGFLNYSNEAIYAVEDSESFLKGTYSNQDDLISADISGVSLSSRAFGQDLINLGNGLDLSTISQFGLPSTLLQNLQKNNGITQELILALLSSGLTQTEITNISNGLVTATKKQEQQIYGAYLIITGRDLLSILVTLNCKTKGLNTLADLLSIKKMFPLSFTTLTVPVYNTNPGPTNSKTYYLLFVKQELNPQLVIPKIKEIVGTIIPPVEPPIVEEPIVIPPPPAPPPPPIEVLLPPVVVPAPEMPAPPPPVQPLPEPPPPVPPPPTILQGGGGGCVALESFVPLVETEKKHNNRPITNAWMLESGIKISLGTEQLEIVDGKVVKTLNDYQPCVRISTADGITLVCSTTAPIFTKDKGFIPSTQVYGQRVAVMRNGRTWYDEVVGLEDVGMKFVRVIDAGNNSFWAGERPGSYILHHNVPINDDMNNAKN